MPKKKNVQTRVVGALTGYNHLVPPRQDPEQRSVKREKALEGTDTTLNLRNLPITPQEKFIQMRNLATKVQLSLDDNCLRALARLPFYRAKDLIDDVVLGGRNRTGVANPSRYLMIGVQKLSSGLGVEQGIAMELAVSLGVVLNNNALDELASIPRKESHAIIREVASNDEARQDPIAFISSEVMRCRAALESTPFGA